MAKKNRKKKQDLPKGMSRRQAKLAARAAERAALEKDARPYQGVAAEAQLVALHEFVPSAVAKLPTKGIDRDVYVATVLPGASAAFIRDNGDAFVGLQVQQHTHNPGRDLAYALNWVKDHQPGDTLESTAADGSQPELSELVDADQPLDITVHQDFGWWTPEGGAADPQVAQAIQAANNTVMETHPAGGEDLTGAAFWSEGHGDKAYIRWVRPADDENAFLNAIARLAARGDMNVGEDTKFAGVFRTHGLIAPVFDLRPDVAHDSYAAELARVDAALADELTNDAQLNADERKQLQNLKSRQVTLR